MRGMIAPSGKQVTIVAKDQQAVIVEVGGGLRSYSVGGRELLDGYGADEVSSSGRGQVLIPWPNRLEDGSYEFNGRRYQLPLNEAEHRNAIHGLVRWSTWTATQREPHRLVMEHILYPRGTRFCSVFFPSTPLRAKSRAFHPKAQISAVLSTMGDPLSRFETPTHVVVWE